MNTREAINYLFDNPKAKLLLKKNINGEDCPKGRYIIKIRDGLLHLEGFGNYMIFMDCKDLREFEPVRELRKMSFGEAYYLYATKARIEANHVTSCVSGMDFVRIGSEISKEEYLGLWTVESVYEE